METGSRVILVATPLLAMATLAVGLRIGASEAIHAAVVYVAPHARGQTAYVWQVATLFEDHGVRDVEAVRGLTVRARGGGHDAIWAGDTNEDGVAEVRLDLPGVERGDAVEVDVRAAGVARPLAHGRIAWDEVAWAEGAPAPFVPSSKREGTLALDVTVLGQRLVSRVWTPLLIRATARDDGHAVSGVTIAADPEPGLSTSVASAVTCAEGWARVDASPIMMVASLSLHARTVDGRTGEWFGELPVAPGAIDAHVLDAKAGATSRVELHAPSERTAYVEIDDELGRAFAAAVPLRPSASGATATLDVPPLGAGLSWVLSSSEPRGAETLAGSALARPFLVGGNPRPIGVPSTDDPCAAMGYVAMHPSGGFHRGIGLDGFAGSEVDNTERRRRGRTVALASLVVAALLESVVLVQASRRGKAGAGRTRDGLAVLVSILLALLGFGLLAAFVVARA